MSAGVATSDVARVNGEAGGLPTRVTGDTLYVVKKAREYGDLSGGRFDVAIGPLVRLWGIGTDHAEVPDPAEIGLARSLVDYRGVEIDEGIVSATVLARRAVGADALSTTVFLLGPSDGMELITRLPGVEGIIVTDDRKVVVSPGLRTVIDVSEGWTVRFHGAEDVQEG